MRMLGLMPLAATLMPEIWVYQIQTRWDKLGTMPPPPMGTIIASR